MSWGVDDHFRLWLRAGMTGCEFARLLAGKLGRIALDRRTTFVLTAEQAAGLAVAPG